MGIELGFPSAPGSTRGKGRGTAYCIGFAYHIHRSGVQHARRILREELGGERECEDHEERAPYEYDAEIPGLLRRTRHWIGVNPVTTF